MPVEIKMCNNAEVINISETKHPDSKIKQTFIGNKRILKMKVKSSTFNTTFGFHDEFCCSLHVLVLLLEIQKAVLT